MKAPLTLSILAVSAMASLAASISYSSSVDALTLTAEFYPATNGAPVLVAMHGYSGTATSFAAATIGVFTNAGFAVVIPDMRGRRAAEGVADDSGREIMDIYDALVYVRSNYTVGATNALIYGLSGGGGNTLAAACKIPDTFVAYVDYFGMSDYGQDATESWYATTTELYRAPMRLYIGGNSVTGTPLNFPNNYAARNALTAIGQNLIGGRLWMFHNTSDTTVPLTNSSRVKIAMDNASNTRYVLTTSPTLYVHGYPTGEPDSFSVWKDAVFDGTVSEWSYPVRGTATVLGYLVTKRFSIWLGGGTNTIATVNFDCGAGRYTVTPVTTDPMVVTVTQPGCPSFSVSGISSQYTFWLKPALHGATIRSGTLRGK